MRKLAQYIKGLFASKPIVLNFYIKVQDAESFRKGQLL